MRIVFVGGGTGGHFYPLMAVAEAVRDKDATAGESSELFYLGPDAYDQASLDALDIKYVHCPAGKQRVYRSVLNLLDKFKTLAGIFVAFFKLLLLYPDVILSKGSYTSVPVILAAWLLRVPVVIHESDTVPGRANKLASKNARYVAVAYAEAAGFFPSEKVAHIGIPVRKSFLTPIADPAGVLGIPNDRPIILITGGSSGAKRLNDFILASLPRLLTNFTIIHQVGQVNLDSVTTDASALLSNPDLAERYFVFGNLDPARFAAAMQAASIVVTRAGSTSLFEIALSGKPSVVVPIPEDISRDQRTNAYAYASHTGAVVLEEHNLSDDILVTEIEHILSNDAVYKQMSARAVNFTTPDAAGKLAGVLRSIAREHE